MYAVYTVKGRYKVLMHTLLNTHKYGNPEYKGSRKKCKEYIRLVDEGIL